MMVVRRMMTIRAKMDETSSFEFEMRRRWVGGCGGKSVRGVYGMFAYRCRCFAKGNIMLEMGCDVVGTIKRKIKV